MQKSTKSSENKWKLQDGLAGSNKDGQEKDEENNKTAI